ncbi:MAG: 2-phospho-L-lactate transferase CofD family protein [Roseiflexaceae bacterium]|nr:2-phospho-L-lactate transferase CofD family protein [Roseiflexus sp.]MDW8212888.1 2-phospho-L-lactate transferase CofD family protein [Roseiflexaceae bacterium]
MQRIVQRLSSLRRLIRPLALTFVGIVLLSLGVAYFFIFIYRTATLPPVFSFITLQFMPLWARGLVFAALGMVALAVGIWQLSGVAVIPLNTQVDTSGELVLAYQRDQTPPRMTVISGGAGLLITASLGHSVQRLTCITPVQDPVEYYYRASSLFNFENVVFVVPTPEPHEVFVELDDGQRFNIKHNIAHDERLAERHVVNIYIGDEQGPISAPLPVTQVALDAITSADVIVFGPGSLYESILPNLLIPDLRDAIRRSKACKIYICSLMTEPGMTTGYSVGDHVRQIVRFGGFTPDYVLVNTPRIDAEVRRIYAAARQVPVVLSPEEYEETAVSTTDRLTTRDILIEGAKVIEADLATAVVQLTASLDHPGEGRTVRVLRHDPEKLATAILEVWKRR